MNVLGVVLGVAVALKDPTPVVIAGLAATFAESISMAAVAYTSIKASRDYYFKEVEREKYEIIHYPQIERREIRDIYLKKGFRGKLLEQVVDKICSDDKVWLDSMMAEELQMSPPDKENPVKSAVLVGVSALAGSLIPLIPFILSLLKVISLDAAFWLALGLSAIALFVMGVAKAKMTIGSPGKSGLEMLVIGMAAAIAGYAIGWLSGAAFVP